MKLSLFDYELPEERIAQYPLSKRDESRLMILDRKNKEIFHSKFKNIGEFLYPGDTLVINDTKVIPARLIGHKKTGAKIEMLLLMPKKRDVWEVMLNPGKRVRRGTIIEFGDGELTAKLLSKLDDTYLVELRYTGELRSILSEIGQTPLPPYINREPEELDRIRYQNVYAQQDGAVAAPTAGLHFTESLINELKEMGIYFVNVTLHVGLGTFQPVNTEEIESHDMHSEFFSISEYSAKKINNAKAENNRVIAVGTTSVRVLESVVQNNDEEVSSSDATVKSQKGFTNLFIYPGYKFKVIDGLITNFHLPKSTLLMLVSAFAGREFVLKAYKEAIEKKYRFYSYGDSMFIY